MAERTYRLCNGYRLVCNQCGDLVACTPVNLGHKVQTITEETACATWPKVAERIRGHYCHPGSHPNQPATYTPALHAPARTKKRGKPSR